MSVFPGTYEHSLGVGKLRLGFRVFRHTLPWFGITARLEWGLGGINNISLTYSEKVNDYGYPKFPGFRVEADWRNKRVLNKVIRCGR